MSDITIIKADGIWSVRAGGAVLAESREALALYEGELPMVVYFPREDIAMAFLEATDHVTTCPKKGAAVHYTIHTKSGEIENAAWSYEAPKEGVARIAGHVAFYGSEFVTVEQI
ncbi:DUF427 domain-containing protein [Maritimibacter alkaliphilus]|uniref:DUF427 domain-containing protein n=1 Tax=Maritimibacter alkaliphilus TaxID=404236 RepID=UPI001C985F54|nr:DUF427 domain-containing protein [Maritimibacter alkaliphilus]MBY6090204.1 DUF427 domain-containing protein [Maritimibacter alkaliphilus]